MNEATQGRPFIRMNMAMTADGKITSAYGDYPSFTSARDQQRMDELRARSDAVLIGAGTLRADDPPLHVRHPDAQALRRNLGKKPPLSVIVVSRALRLSPDARFFTDPAALRIVATVEDAPPDRIEALPAAAEIWKLGRGDVDLPALVHRLYDRGIRDLLVEGGGELNWGFAQADLFDELYITVAPALLGGRSAPTIMGGPGWHMAEHRKLELVTAEREGDEVFFRYRVPR